MFGSAIIRHSIMAIATMMVFSAASAQAAPVDLFQHAGSTGFTSGPTTHNIEGGTFSSYEGLNLNTFDGKPSICGAAGTDRCIGSMRLDFNAPVKNFGVHFDGYDTGDYYGLYLFNASNTILTSYGITGNGSVKFTGPLEISYALFVFGSNLSMEIEKIGMYFHSFEFDLVNSSVSTVPLPAGLPLFAGALSLLAIWRLKRKA